MTPKTSLNLPVFMISQELLNLGTIGALAVSADARKVYLGRQNSYDRDRLNLAVLDLDAAGKPAGPPSLFADNDTPLPLGARSSVTLFLLDSDRRKLYLGVDRENPPGEVRSVLTVYDLTPDGRPAHSHSYEIGNPYKSLRALARHPTLNLLYLVGWGGTAVYVYTLDGQGWPQGFAPQTFPVGSEGKYQVAVSAGGERLYLGTYPDILEVVDLDAAGLPKSASVRSFQATNWNKPGEAAGYLQFAYTPRALYRLPPAGDSSLRPLVVWQLASQGDPSSAPQQFPASSGHTTAVDAKQNVLWIAAEDTFVDAFSGAVVADGVVATAIPIEAASGLPAGAGQKHGPLVYRRFGALSAVAANGTLVLLTQSLPQSMPDGFLGNQVGDWWLRVTVQKATLRAADGTTSPAPTPFPAWLRRSGATDQPLQNVTSFSQPLAAVSLDQYLKGADGQLLFWVVVYSTTQLLDSLTVTLDLFQGNPAHGGRPLESLTDTVQGSLVAFLVPGYDFEPPGERLRQIELLSGHAERYLAAAQPGLMAEQRPQQFIISSYHLLGGQGHAGQLEAEAKATTLLGMNTVNAYIWDGISPAKVNDVLKAAGLWRRMEAVYAPPSYFDFDQKVMNPSALAAWAKGLVPEVTTTSGGDLADVVLFHIADEPGWYYPGELERVRNDPDLLEAYRAYVKSKGLPWWNGATPVGASEATDALLRQQFYWTMRFFTESASRGLSLARQAIETALGHPVAAPVNWNNSIGQWYVASPNQKVANNPQVGPDSAMGLFDWMVSGRQSAHTLWTEDWFSDQAAQYWSVMADALRSASMLGRQEFGGYVVGKTIGQHPSGASYKILSLIGHGAKVVSIYTFCHWFLFGDCWSENLSNPPLGYGAYRPLREALGLVGRAERLLFPGRPARGKVAIMPGGASSLWDAKNSGKIYQSEATYLHFALIHAGYTVDFVDEVDVAQGELSKRGYTTLYLIGPNVANDHLKAQKAIADWVQAGGVLAAVLGAAVADEYNATTSVLDAVLGVQPRLADRDVEDGATRPGATLTFTDPSFGNGTLDISAPVTALQPSGAEVAATLGGGEAGITRNRYGKGQAVAFGFFPGRQYWQTPNRDDPHRLPLRWGEAQRRMAVAPALIAKTPFAVGVSHELVEACRLQSDAGSAVVLLNWSDEKIPELTVTLPGAHPYRQAISVSRGVLPVSPSPAGLEARLPLDAVDILLFE